MTLKDFYISGYSSSTTGCSKKGSRIPARGVRKLLVAAGGSGASMEENGGGFREGRNEEESIPDGGFGYIEV
jgi:hypothetical protein